MIPERIDQYLRENHLPYTHSTHVRAVSAQRFAAAEPIFERRFAPCEVGAEPPLRLFGMPLYVDAALARARRIMMRGGTHEDAIELDTEAWLRSEGATPIEHLGGWMA